MTASSRLFPQLRRIGRFGWRDWADMGRASYELGLARLRLTRLDPSGFRAPSALQTFTPLPPEADIRIGRVSRAIARAARLVPWRSDCLVQAEAARRWLNSHGLRSEIRIGARKSPDNGLDAHAWLLCGGVVVTGGDISPYAAFA